MAEKKKEYGELKDLSFYVFVILILKINLFEYFVFGNIKLLNNLFCFIIRNINARKKTYSLGRFSIYQGKGSSLIFEITCGIHLSTLLFLKQ